MNSPKRPSFSLSFAWLHFGHVSSSSTSGFFAVLVPAAILRVVLHSGYPVQARNCPNLPRLSAIGLPQFSQGSGSASAAAASPPSLGGSSTAISLVFLHSG